MCAPGQITGQLAGQVKFGFGNPQIPNCQKLWTNIGRACPIEPSGPVGAVKSRIPGGNFEITTTVALSLTLALCSPNQGWNSAAVR